MAVKVVLPRQIAAEHYYYDPLSWKKVVLVQLQNHHWEQQLIFHDLKIKSIKSIKTVKE